MAILAPEDIARRVISIYEDNYNASLIIVAVARDATEEVTLTDFVSRRISASPEVMPRAWESPLLQVGIGNMVEVATEGGRYQQYHSMFDLDVQCFYYLKHPDNRTLALMILRHKEATLDLLNKHPALDYGHHNRIVEGSLELLPSNTAPAGTNVLVKGLMVRFRFRFMQYGA